MDRFSQLNFITKIMYLEEDFEHAAAKDFVYLLADQMLDEHLPKIEVIDQDKVFKDEDRHNSGAVRRYNFKGIHDGHGVPADDDTRTV
jgi:hypothetical protein